VIRLLLLLAALPIAAEEAKPVVKFHLPFPAGKTWTVAIGNDQDPGHKDQYNKYAFDFDMPEGSDLCAVADGVVTGLKEDTKGPTGNGADNNFVEVLHADGTTSVYHHLQKGGVLVEVGDRVFAGDVIAKSGQTGAARGPHLHFGLMDAGKNSIPIRFEDVPGGVPKKGWACASKNARVRDLPAIRACIDFLRAKEIALPFRMMDAVCASHAAVERAKDPGIDSWKALRPEIESGWAEVEEKAKGDLAAATGAGEFAARLALLLVAREQYARTPWEEDFRKAISEAEKDPAYKDESKNAQPAVEAWRQAAAAAKEDLAGRGARARGMYEAYVKKAGAEGPWVAEATARIETLPAK